MKMELSIFVLPFFVFAVTGSGSEDLISPEEDHSSTPNNKTLSGHPIFLVVSFDGFRYDYFSKGNTPHLDWVKDHGVSAPYMKPQFPTKTFPNHHSIATGLHPESHGIVNNKLWDPLYNKTLGVGDEAYWVYNDDVVPLWVLNEWGGGVSGVIMWPGSEFPYGANKTTATYVTKWNPEVSFESRINTALDWLTNDVKPANLIFLYFEEPDDEAHGFGPDSDEVRLQIERMDKQAGHLIHGLRTRGIIDSVNLIFLSDHGFENVHPQNVVNITALVNPSRYNAIGSTPNYLIQPTNDEDTESLYEDFKLASQKYNFSIYRKKDIAKEKPYWFYARSRRIMPLVLLADLGFAFDIDFYSKMDYFDKKFNVTRSSDRTYGVHGYDNHLIRMYPFFRARGPVFRSGIEIEPFNNVDLFPLLCHLLKLKAPPNNGTLIKMENLLFRHGFHIGAPIGLIIGGGMLAGVSILLLIFVFFVQRRKGRSSYVGDYSEPTVGYRYVKNGNGAILEYDGNRNGLQQLFGGVSSPEGRALLKSLSEESLSSTDNQIG